MRTQPPTTRADPTVRTPHSGTVQPRKTRRGSLPAALALCLMLAVLDLGLASFVVTHNPDVADFFQELSLARVRAIGLIVLDDINEQPGIDIVPTSTRDAPVCEGVEARYVPAIAKAFSLMRGTADGQALFETLIRHDVCVAVKDIQYNGGFATSWRSSTGEWFHGTITIDDDYIRSRQADVLAAMLVHEATHIDRAIDGESCDDRADCDALPNGVELDEEFAAHAAEARWWLAAYGDDGKRFAFGADYGENQLASAYRDGAQDFRRYVRELRSDPREGAGI